MHAPTLVGISIHALHEESDSSIFPTVRVGWISIHALHEESDVGAAGITPACAEFQSTLSMRRATSDSISISTPNVFQSTLSMRRATGRVDGGVDVLPVISIHALHEESDPCFERSVILLHISIHALHEESDHIDQSPAVAIKFQSTLSMRRATAHCH